MTIDDAFAVGSVGPPNVGTVKGVPVAFEMTFATFVSLMRRSLPGSGTSAARATRLEPRTARAARSPSRSPMPVRAMRILP